MHLFMPLWCKENGFLLCSTFLPSFATNINMFLSPRAQKRGLSFKRQLGAEGRYFLCLRWFIWLKQGTRARDPRLTHALLKKAKTNIRGHFKAWFPERKCVQCTFFSPPCNVVQKGFLSFAYVPSFLSSCLSSFVDLSVCLSFLFLCMPFRSFLSCHRSRSLSFLCFPILSPRSHPFFFRPWSSGCQRHLAIQHWRNH